ncbi:alpha/beta hydrolase fold domain-containing protein [Phyllobacterium myrsinacearum]|uniref:Alpha/beta hydrolase fold-3 domain-containing protein n=1 Tax=Phyllobacterium myrsinacearum TaxID=28101 RepID=A0A839EQ73_9HYPH|nr:alpha/beta hydrolase fold domain-containing protein [Phyllobacterium myrsinacearum]MBA8879654.1 hypothetical protein [Phyllobacterium myrsinacearum]
MQNPFPANMSSYVAGQIAKLEDEQRRQAEITAAYAASDIFAGIDGTGVFNNQQYQLEFQNSFVNRIFREWNTPAKFYRRGPSIDGVATANLAFAAFEHVYKLYSQKNGRPKRIFLAGYSRGGAAATKVCDLLQDRGVPVHGLFLFDAVDRAMLITPGFIPKNVEYCFHARRDPRSNSRNSFGSYGTKAHRDTTVYRERFFYCTHGGMGGVPWLHADPDGYINEAENINLGKPIIQNPVLRSLALTNPATAGLVISDHLARQGNNAYRAAGRTNVTLQQDKAGSAEVGQWMFAALRELRKDNATAHVPTS